MCNFLLRLKRYALYKDITQQVFKNCFHSPAFALLGLQSGKLQLVSDKLQFGCISWLIFRKLRICVCEHLKQVCCSGYVHIQIPSSENVSQHNMYSAELCRSFPVKEVNFIFSASSVFLKWVSRC